jgi:hypothetical protein
MNRPALLAVGGIALMSSLAGATTIAEDNGFAAFGSNSGTGFGNVTAYSSPSGGGLFSATLDGDAYGMFAADNPSTGQTAYRQVTAAPVGGWTAGGNNLVTLSLSLRFDINNSNNIAFVNLKNAVGSNRTDGELLAFGVVSGNNAKLRVIGSATTDLTFSNAIATNSSPPNIDLSVTYNTQLGTYTLSATNRSSSQTLTTSGNLANPGGGYNPGAVAFINNNLGTNQNLIWDNLKITAVPEPLTAAALGLITMSILHRRSQRAI